MEMGRTRYQRFCGWLLTKVLGWTIDDGTVDEPKCIILGVPHTSIWDLPVSYLYYKSQGGDAKVMIKKEAFKWPLAPILRFFGGVPMDRQNPTAMVRSIIRHFREAETFHLAMCPEGTRKAVKRWKPGFHWIATQTGVSVYLGYFNWGTKHISRGEKFTLTDDVNADIAAIRKIYKEMHLVGKHPERYNDEL